VTVADSEFPDFGLLIVLFRKTFKVFFGPVSFVYDTDEATDAWRASHIE
jgi:hypothetical protein